MVENCPSVYEAMYIFNLQTFYLLEDDLQKLVILCDSLTSLARISVIVDAKLFLHDRTYFCKLITSKMRCRYSEKFVPYSPSNISWRECVFVLKSKYYGYSGYF
jgi:hypothetical protein